MSIKLGIIGCGIATEDLHWPELEKMQDKFTITAVCNHTKPKALRFAETVGKAYKTTIPYVMNYHDLLAMNDVEAVAVNLPVELNRQVCRDAAAAGKHIIVEKPVAENLESAMNMLRLEEEYPDLVMMVAENFRYIPTFTTLAEALRSGKIGTPYYAEWKCWMKIEPATNKYAKTSWRKNHKFEGGFVTDGGVHNVAVLRDIFGDLEIIGSQSHSINPAIGRTDTMVCLFRSKGTEGIPPVTGVFNIGFSVSGLSSYELQVLGSRGAAVFDGSKITIYGPDKEKGPLSLEDSSKAKGYYEEYLDFYKAISSGTTPVSTFKKAYGDLETILKALEK